MSYRVEKNLNGEKDLVIEGWGNGLADSALEGIADMRNLNTYYQPGAAYINYKRQLVSTAVDSQTATFSNGSANITTSLNVQKGDTVTFGSTVGNFTSGTKYWVVTSSAGVITASATIGGSAQVANANGSATATTVVMKPVYYGDTNMVNNFYVVDTDGNLWSNEQASVFSNTSRFYFTIIHWGTVTSAGNDTQYQGLVYFAGIVFIIQNNGSIDAYVANSSPGAGYTTAWKAAASVTPTSTHYSIVANDGICYICNGATSFSSGGKAYKLATITTTSEGVLGAYTFTASGSAAGFPQPQTFLSELQDSLVVTGINTLYFWDKTSTGFSSFLPMTERIVSVTNIQNILYILAGTKGNIYICNGYSISHFKKIPDHMTDVLDPSWKWGGATAHRGRLIFGACSINQISTGSPVFGIFSLNLLTKELNFENLNSCGSTITADPTGYISNAWVLFDLNSLNLVAEQAFDNYLSFWYNYPSGGADVSDTASTTLTPAPVPYQNYEPYIIADLIPVGTILQQRTFNIIEYKLLKPLVAGESLKIYYRTALGQSWTLIWTSTATGAVSDYSPVNFQKSQWLQFQVAFAGISASSSFIPFKELRIR